MARLIPRRVLRCAECGCAGVRESLCAECECCADCCFCTLDELFDADELGLDPEDDEERRYPGA